MPTPRSAAAYVWVKARSWVWAATVVRDVPSGQIVVGNPARFDVYEDGYATLVANAIGGRDEAVADGHDLVAGTDPGGPQGQLERHGAVGDGAGMVSAYRGSEFRFELGHLGTLGDPAGQKGATERFGLLLPQPGPGDGYPDLLRRRHVAPLSFPVHLRSPGPGLRQPQRSPGRLG